MCYQYKRQGNIYVLSVHKTKQHVLSVHKAGQHICIISTVKVHWPLSLHETKQHPHAKTKNTIRVSITKKTKQYQSVISALSDTMTISPTLGKATTMCYQWSDDYNDSSTHEKATQCAINNAVKRTMITSITKRRKQHQWVIRMLRGTMIRIIPYTRQSNITISTLRGTMIRIIPCTKQSDITISTLRGTMIRIIPHITISTLRDTMITSPTLDQPVIRRAIGTIFLYTWQSNTNVLYTIQWRVQ